MARRKYNPPQVGETVYLITDPDSIPRLITKFKGDFGTMKYRLVAGDRKSWHYEQEITREPAKRIEIKGLAKK
jgi:hypothetical protein